MPAGPTPATAKGNSARIGKRTIAERNSLVWLHALPAWQHLPRTEQDQNVNVQTDVQTGPLASFVRIA